MSLGKVGGYTVGIITVGDYSVSFEESFSSLHIKGCAKLLAHTAYSISHIYSNTFLGSCFHPLFFRLAFLLRFAHHGGNKYKNSQPDYCKFSLKKM